jgi:hypothetical protein
MASSGEHEAEKVAVGTGGLLWIFLLIDMGTPPFSTCKSGDMLFYIFHACPVVQWSTMKSNRQGELDSKTFTSQLSL